MDTNVKTSNLKLKSRVQVIEQKTINNRYELEVALEDKVYPETYYNHQPNNVVVDETPAKIKAQELQIVGWMLPKSQQLMKFNLRTNVEPQLVKMNAQLETNKVLEAEQLLKKFKDVFAWTQKDMKGMPPELTHHKIEFNIAIPSAHQARYILNPNYVKTIKQDINKLLAFKFIQFVKEAKWLSHIMVIIKKNGKLKICINFKN